MVPPAGGGDRPTGPGWLESGHREALDTIDDAERAGFEVGEDYSVTDTREVSSREQLAQRQGQAQAHRTSSAIALLTWSPTTAS
ncbi:MAG TPA: hypothetical protein VE197_19815 [Mycobacterium sp.]|nr:hypothetical protein [Mycobacterium sp.]